MFMNRPFYYEQVSIRFHRFGVCYELYKLPLQTERNRPTVIGNFDCQIRLEIYVTL